MDLHSGEYLTGSWHNRESVLHTPGRRDAVPDIGYAINLMLYSLLRNVEMVEAVHSSMSR